MKDNKLLQVRNFPFDKVYFGMPQRIGNSMKLDRPLFITPYKQIGSIFAIARNQQIRSRIGGANLTYDEWVYPIQNDDYLSEVHVKVKKSQKDFEPFEIDCTGYVYEIDVSDLKDNIYKYAWMAPKLEFLIANVNEVTFSNIKTIHAHAYVDKVKTYSIMESYEYIQESDLYGKPFDMSRIKSSALRTYLSKYKVLTTNGEEFRKATNKRTVIACVSNTQIILFEDDIKRAGITDKELTCILWHELAHRLLDTSDEKRCDEYAILQTDEATYKSAVMKTKRFVAALRKEHGVTQSEESKKKYGHRDVIQESHRHFNNIQTQSDQLHKLTRNPSNSQIEIKAIKLYERMSEFFYKEYDEFKSPKKFEISKSGNCWSFAEYEEDYVNKNGMHCTKFYVFAQKDSKIMTHSFIVIQGDMSEQCIYIERAFKRIRGVYWCNDVRTIFDHVLKAISESMDINTFNYVIFDYTGQHPPYGCTNDEFMTWIPNHCEDIVDGSYSNKTIIKEEYHSMEFDRMKTLRMILESDDTEEKEEQDVEENDEDEAPKKKAPSRFKQDDDDVDTDTSTEDEDGEMDGSDADENDNSDSDDLSDFGNHGSDELPNNEYDPAEVETLNNLMASEADAMNEYLDAARVSRVDVLQRLYADIANEERFHMEQLLFAKSEITGEKYVPRDKDVRKEYEELLELGMDEDTAMATAVDKVGIAVKSETTNADVDNLNEDMKKLEGDVEMMEQMANQLILVSYICEYAERSRDAELINEVNIYQESVIMEDVTGIPQEDKKYTKSINPIKVAWDLFKNFLKFLRNLAKNMQKFRAQLNYRIAKTREWCKKHGGIGALFAGEGIWMYTWNDHSNNIEYDGLSYYANLLWAMTQNIAQQTQSQNPEIQKILSMNDAPFDVTNKQGFAIDKKTDAKKIIQILGQAILTKTKIVFNENNKERLNELFLGVKTDNDESIKYDSSKRLNPASFNNVYVALMYMEDRITIFSQYAEKLTEALGKMEGEPNGLFHTNNQLYLDLCKYMQTSARWYTKLGKIIHNDINAIVSITSAGNKPSTEDQNPNGPRVLPKTDASKQILEHQYIKKQIEKINNDQGINLKILGTEMFGNNKLVFYSKTKDGEWRTDTVKRPAGFPEDLIKLYKQAGLYKEINDESQQTSDNTSTSEQNDTNGNPQPQQQPQQPQSKGDTLIGGGDQQNSQPQQPQQQPQNQDLQIATNTDFLNKQKNVRGYAPIVNRAGEFKGFDPVNGIRNAVVVVYNGKCYPNPNKYPFNNGVPEKNLNALNYAFTLDGLTGNDNLPVNLVRVVPAQISVNGDRIGIIQKGQLTFELKK